MADIQVKYTSDMQKLLRDQDKTIQKQDAQIKKLESTAREARKLGSESASASSKAAKGTDTHAAAVSKLASSVRNTIGSYVAFGAVLRGFSATLQDNIQLSKEAADAQRLIGAAQQEAAKNLTGLPSAEKKEILETVAPDIQRRTLFPKQEQLVEAIGAGFSASGNRQATLSAVEASAQLTRLTPSELPSVAAGALDIAQATGVEDARKNLGFLLSAGAINRIEDPTLLSRNVAPVVTSAVANAPQQQPEEAAREAGALFGVLAKSAADFKGESSSTAAITLIGKLDTFFRDRADDPGTLFGRIGALQQDDRLKREVLGDEGFGEQKFKKGIELILTAGTKQAQLLESGKQQVTFDSSLFETQVRELNTLTPAIKGAMLQAASEANLQLSKTQPQEANAAIRREILTDTLRQTRRPTDFLALPVEFAQTAMADVGIGSAEGSLQMRRDALLGRNLPGQGEPTEREMRALTPSMRADVETIGRQLELLEQLPSERGSMREVRDLKSTQSLEQASLTLRDAAQALMQASTVMTNARSVTTQTRERLAPAARQAASMTTE